MIQQINLYQDVLTTDQNQSVISTLVISIIAIIVLLVGFSIYLLMNLNATEQNLKSARKELKDTELRLQQLQIQYPDRTINNLIIQEIVHSQKIFKSLTRVIGLLNDDTSVQNQGFSQYFSALARQSISEVWLNSIFINAKKNQLEFQGSTYHPEKIPVLLQKWHLEPIFQGKDFARLTLLQAEEKENQIDFIVSSNTELSEEIEHE